MRDDHDSGDLVVVDLVVEAGERDRELVVRVADVREVRVGAGHQLGRHVHVDVALALAVVAHTSPSIAPCESAWSASGRLRPPFADDVAHYERLLRAAGPARDGRAVRETGDPAREARGGDPEADPGDAFVCVLDREGDEMPSERLAGWLEERAPGRARPLVRRSAAPSASTRPVLEPRRPAALARARSRCRTSSRAWCCWSSSSALTRSSTASRTITELATARAATRRRPVERLRAELAAPPPAARARRRAAAPSLERPPRAEFGDYSTNLALLLAPALKSPPREIAERIGDDAAARGSADVLERVEVAGPGLPQPVPGATPGSARALAADPRAGRRGSAPASFPRTQRERILVEFVSANPTGPLTAAERPPRRLRRLARAGARVRRARGRARVLRQRLRHAGASCSASRSPPAMTGEEVPEDGYEGDYVRRARASRSRAEGIDPGDVDALARRGVELMMERVRATLERFRVRFDRFFSERSLHETGAVERGARRARASEHVYESEGATWLRTTHLRRRQGPRAAPLLGRADLLRAPTSPTTQDKRGARLRPPDQRARAPTTTATWRG